MAGSTPDKPVKVALWCVPRSGSTALSKCLTNIDGIEVWFESFSSAWSSEYILRQTSGKQLPMELSKECGKLYQEAYDISEKKMGYQDMKTGLESTTSKFVFNKDMAYAINTHREYIPEGFKHCFLIREPSRVLVSYRKAAIAAFTNPDSGGSAVYDIIRDDPFGIHPATMYQHQYELWTYIKEHIDPSPVIIDGFDLLSQPGTILKSFCDAVGLPYSNDLLHWEAGSDIAKGWRFAASDVLSSLVQFYGRAMSSTEFVAPTESLPIPRDQLTDDVICCLDASMPYYQEMYANRMQLD